MSDTSRAVEILRELIRFPTVSADSNLALIDFVAGHLTAAGGTIKRIPDGSGTKSNLFATFGPETAGGIALSGHTDVVPVDGQEWSFDPFAGAVSGGRVWGRGTTDMKGFIACVMALAPDITAWPLARPIHVALTHDEEIGCLGARGLLSSLEESGPMPAMVIIGEPTGLEIVAAHKGCYEYTTEIRGLEGHASLPHQGVNAIHAAVRFITRLQELADELVGRAPAGSAFDPPYSTIGVGTINGGIARNIIPGSVAFDWEMRTVRGDDLGFVLGSLDSFVQDELLSGMRRTSPDADVVTATVGAVGPLEPDQAEPAARLVDALIGPSPRRAVPFGTEAGVYQEWGVSAVVCGPGNIEQAHTPDEFIEISELERCLEMLRRLRDQTAGQVMTDQIQ